MDKLVLAEDTSNIDMSSDGLREQKKERRRMKAKKIISSSSSDEDVDLDGNNSVRSNKSLPSYPNIENFMLSNTIHSDKSQAFTSKKTFTLSSDSE